VTEQQRDHFLDTVIVEVECDGVPQEVTPLLFFADDVALFVAHLPRVGRARGCHLSSPLDDAVDVH